MKKCSDILVQQTIIFITFIITSQSSWINNMYSLDTEVLEASFERQKPVNQKYTYIFLLHSLN